MAYETCINCLKLVTGGHPRDGSQLCWCSVEDMDAVKGMTRTIPTEDAKWIPSYPIPPIGQRVLIHAWTEGDNIPKGTVTGYQATHGFLMIWVRPDFRPRWHRKDNPHRHLCLFAGIELEPVSE